MTPADHARTASLTFTGRLRSVTFALRGIGTMGKAKHVAAGAVLLTAIGAVIIGLLVFWPHVTARWSHV